MKYKVYWKHKNDSEFLFAHIGNVGSYGFFKDYYADINEAFGAINRRTSNSTYSLNDYILREES